MRTIYSNYARSLTALMLAAMTVLLASCGASGTTTASTSSTSGTTAGAPSILIALTDPTTGLTTTSTPATAKATVVDANGAPVPNVVVTFTVADTTIATLTPSTGSALTNASGVATVTVNAASSTAGGATTLSASAQVGTSTATGSIGFSINASAPVAGVTLTGLTFGVNPLAAYGTTSMTATVTPTTTPVTVTFTSTCASANPAKATLSASVTSVNGVATGSYLDNGCASTDMITASVTGTSATTQASLVVNPPATGSLQFVSASPTTIFLQGTGGTSTSTVSFKVLDSGGNPISGKVVTFGLSTTLGGITFTPNVAAPTATSDSSGLVSIIVNAGTMSTPVRVTASTPGATAGSTLSTQSSQLTITTGIPDQDSFSLAASVTNIEGWTLDGMTSILTARLSDHFNNPVPDGTAVNFTSEGGSVVGSCTTVNGACTSTFTSMQPRPTNGRLTVLAFAVGEESFTDMNGNGLADPGEMTSNGQSTDMPEAFSDYNEDGLVQTSTTTAVNPITGAVTTTTNGIPEPYLDFDNSGSYTGPDGLYNGSLCNTAVTPNICSSTKSIDVRRSLVLTLSSSTPTFGLFDGSNTAATAITLPSCDTTVVNNTMPVTTYYVMVVDVNGNAMPTGTTINFATSNGTLLSQANWTTLNTTGCSTHFPGCPASAGTAAFGYYPVQMQSDATYNSASTPACTNSKTSGVLTVTVKTPSGVSTVGTVTVND